MQAILSLKRKISESFTLSFEESERHFTTYGIAVIIGIFGFYLFNLWVHNKTGYENFTLRLFAASLALLLILRNYWPHKLKPMLKWYWYFTLIYTLPFFFTFMLLHNSSSNIWQINGLIGLVVLALFVDWIAYIALVIVGSSAGLFAYYLMQGNSETLIAPELKGVILNYIAPIIYIMLFSTKRENIQKEKQQSLKMQAGAIAHEMRTPLSAIDAIAGGLKLHLPTLIHTQKMVQEKDQSIPRIHKNALQSLSEAPDELKVISRSAFTVVDMLLTNLKEDVPENTSEKCSILQCVETSLDEYSLRDSDKKLISVEIKDDFKFYGNSLMIKHVLFNLLKNALHYLKAANKGKITIWTETGSKVNRLYFEDTGKGIPKDYLPHIFNQFFTRTAFGSGVGLAFCKMVMTKLGGDITCESVEGDYTRFILTFPTLTEEKLP